MSLSLKPNSKGDNNYEHCNKSRDSCSQMLKCGDVGQALFFNDAEIGTSLPAATIVLDTSKFCNPCIMFEFTSNIIGTLFLGTLNFQLYRACNNQLPVPIGPQYTFAQTTIPVISANAFTFSVCDCNTCSDENCIYTVIVSVGGTGPIIGNIGIFATRLVAIIENNPENTDDFGICNKPNYKENSAILKCGTTSGTLSLIPGILPGTISTVSTISLNTSGLCDPCVKLEFTSNITYSSPTTIDSTVINFQVFKTCGNQRNPVPVGPMVSFSAPYTTVIAPPVAPGFSGTSTFSFFVCDCDIGPNECCTYSVVATTATVDSTVTITNANLVAIAANSLRNSES